MKFALSVYGWHHDVHKFAHSQGGEEAVSTEENKALVRRFVDEVQIKGHTDLIDEICSPEFVNHSTPQGLPPDREGIKMVTAMFREAFPDSYFTVKDMIGEGDKVSFRMTASGTHQAEFAGISPTGRRINFQGMETMRFENGQAVERWGEIDQIGMLQQLGAFPPPGQ